MTSLGFICDVATVNQIWSQHIHMKQIYWVWVLNWIIYDLFHTLIGYGNIYLLVFGLFISNTTLFVPRYIKPKTKFIRSPTILSTSTDCPPCSPLSVLLHPLSPALCWCTDFLFREGKPVCYAGEFQRKGDNPSAARLSLCYNSADKTTDPYLHAESALHHAEHLPRECHAQCRSLVLLLFMIIWPKLWKLCC